MRGRAGDHVSGCAYLGGRGERYDVCLTLPREQLSARKFMWLAHHELMHTYGYSHQQYQDLTPAELEALLPTDYEMPRAAAHRRKDPTELKVKRIESLLKRQVRWHRRLKRAQQAVKKIAKSLRYYEREHPELLLGRGPRRT